MYSLKIVSDQAIIIDEQDDPLFILIPIEATLILQCNLLK